MLGAVLAGVVVVLSLLWWLCTRQPPGLPPTPGLALPLLGHLHLMRSDSLAQMREWRRRHGDVFCLYLRNRLMVVISGFPVFKEALVKMGDVFSDRSKGFIVDSIGKNRGVINTSGPMWKEQRKACVEILRHLGMGKNVLALRVQEEITHYVTAIHRLQGAPTDLHKLTTVSVSNNICSIVFGRRFDYDDPVFREYLDRMDFNVKHLSAVAVVDCFPIVMHAPGDLLHIKRIMSNVNFVDDTFLQPQIDSHKQTADEEGEARDFIHAYLRERKKKEEKGEATSLDDLNLLKTTGDLFVAGSETTTTAISWTLLIFLHHPEVQDRCYKELRDVIGTNRPPAMSDRPRMTYLEATIMEVLRERNIPAVGVPHATACDVNFRGYFIPKGAVVLPVLDSVLRDPEIWGDPENFRPERFIGPDNKIVKPEEFIPFGIGRRMCLGESLARMELFLYLSTLVQHFRFLPPEDGQLPSLDDGTMGLVHQPPPYTIRAVPRD